MSKRTPKQSVASPAPENDDISDIESIVSTDSQIEAPKVIKKSHKKIPLDPMPKPTIPVPVVEPEVKEKRKVGRPKGEPKEKAPYVMTPARAEAFAKARKVREANLVELRAAKEVETQVFAKLKEKMALKKTTKSIKKQVKELKELDTDSDSGSEDERPPTPVKKRSHRAPKQQYDEIPAPTRRPNVVFV